MPAGATRQILVIRVGKGEKAVTGRPYAVMARIRLWDVCHCELERMSGWRMRQNDECLVLPVRKQ